MFSLYIYQTIEVIPDGSISPQNPKKSCKLAQQIDFPCTPPTPLTITLHTEKNACYPHFQTILFASPFYYNTKDGRFSQSLPMKSFSQAEADDFIGKMIQDGWKVESVQ